MLYYLVFTAKIDAEFCVLSKYFQKLFNFLKPNFWENSVLWKGISRTNKANEFLSFSSSYFLLTNKFHKFGEVIHKHFAINDYNNTQLVCG